MLVKIILATFFLPYCIFIHSYNNKTPIKIKPRYTAINTKRVSSIGDLPANEFKKLNSQAPGNFYLIQANSKYALFTSSKNRDFVLYDFSGMDIPNVK